MRHNTFSIYLHAPPAHGGGGGDSQIRGIEVCATVKGRFLSSLV